MSEFLEAVAKEVFDAIAPITPAIEHLMVWADPENDCIMVGTEETAITIRRKAIDAGLHVETAKALVPSLVEAVVAAGAVKMRAQYPTAPMTLAEAVADIERRVGSMHPEDGNIALAPTGEEYLSICNGYVKPQGAPVYRAESDEQAIWLWHSGMVAYLKDHKGTLYWRKRPELDSAVHAVYARLLVSDKPVIYPARLAPGETLGEPLHA